MNNISSLNILIAALASIITTVVSYRVLREQGLLGNPFVLAVCTGLLSFIGLCKYLSDQRVNFILIGYVALTIALVMLAFFLAFFSFGSHRKPNSNTDQGIPQSPDSGLGHDDTPNNISQKQKADNRRDIRRED